MAFVDHGKDAAGRQHVDFTFARGDTKTIRLVLEDTAGDPIDLTSCTAKLSVHTVEEPVDLTTQLFAITGTIVDAPNGVVQFKPSVMQATQAPDDYYYDVQVILADGTVCSVAAGLWTVVADRADANA